MLCERKTIDAQYLFSFPRFEMECAFSGYSIKVTTSSAAGRIRGSSFHVQYVQHVYHDTEYMHRHYCSFDRSSFHIKLYRVAEKLARMDSSDDAE